ncbi:MAG: RNA polymerase sigma factor [Thermomicrobiales bacterium]|nr:sigma-70 family RNA polymerase sigma factor [Thermomicrobiales bacterium]
MVGEPLPLPRTTRVTPALEAAGDAVLAARGEVDAFIRLYREYLPAVYHYAYARLGNAQDAEDVTAQVFERAWGSIGRYRPTGSFRGWLFTIAHRAVADHYRQFRQASHQAFSVDTLADTLRDPAAGPEEQGLIAAEIQRLLAIVAALRPAQQQVIALRFLADLPYDEIARIVGKREATVKMIAYRALAEIGRRHDDA